MRLAVFTSMYPGQTTTFFERDMQGLLEAGIDIDVFAIHPLNAGLWRYATITPRLPRERVHHLGFAESLARARPVWRRGPGAWTRDAAATLLSAARFGPVAFAKTAYSLPKAWAWAAERAYRYDHVLGYWGNYAGTCAWAFHRLQGRSIPFSIWLHAGTDLYRSPVFMRRKLEYADNVLTCCDFNRDYIVRRFGADVPGLDAKTHVFHHGLDLLGFPFQPDDRPPSRVIAVGRLAAHKGYDYLLWATHILQTRGVELSVELVGDGEEREALRTLAADLGIERLVNFRGWLPFQEARRAMSEATLLVQPSDGLGDGLPNVLREAMAVGTPAIASRVAGIPDALEGGCGVLVAPKDSLALADAIESLLAHPEERRRIAGRARARVETRYDLAKNGALLAARLLATRRRASAALRADAVERRRRPRPALVPDEDISSAAREGLVI